jgi:hypothetical protein
MAFWMGAMAFHGIGIEAISNALEGDSTTADISIDPLAAPDEKRHRQEKLVRSQKLHKWVADDKTVPRLLLGTTIMSPALCLLGSFFAASRMGARTGALLFCSRSTSPAEKAVQALLGMLGDPNRPEWLPFLEGKGWVAHKQQSGVMLLLAFVSNLVMRCILPFDVWPLEIGKLCHPDIGDAEKLRIASELWALNECCISSKDFFSLKFKSLHDSRDDLLKPSTLQFVSDVFAQLDVSTITTEDRFARARQHLHQDQGFRLNGSQVIAGEVR